HQRQRDVPLHRLSRHRVHLGGGGPRRRLGRGAHPAKRDHRGHPLRGGLVDLQDRLRHDLKGRQLWASPPASPPRPAPTVTSSSPWTPALVGRRTTTPYG